MKQLTLVLVVALASPAVAQTCPTGNCSGSVNSAWCRTASRADYRDASGRYCDMCSPNQGLCLAPNGDDCVNDCRTCTNGSGQQWVQDVSRNCVTASTPYSQLCQLCIPGVDQAMSCDPFYCGAIDAIHCRVRDCFTCP